MSARWTAARIAGLHAFAGRGLVRESNATGLDADGTATIYWQSARWLESEGFVRPAVTHLHGTWWELTGRGVDRLASLGPPVELLCMNPGGVPVSKRIHSTGDVVVELFGGANAHVRITRLRTSEMLLLTPKEWLDLRDSILAAPGDDEW